MVKKRHGRGHVGLEIWSGVPSTDRELEVTLSRKAMHRIILYRVMSLIGVIRLRSGPGPHEL